MTGIQASKWTCTVVNASSLYLHLLNHTFVNCCFRSRSIQAKRSRHCLSKPGHSILVIKLNYFYCSTCRIVGDNIDMEIRARVQDKQHTNRSVHWTHQFAVKDKVVDLSLNAEKSEKSSKDVQLADLLPTQGVMNKIKASWAVLISRVLVTYVEKLSYLESSVVKHIPHAYSKEMKTKSNSVSSMHNELTSDTQPTQSQ